MTVSALVKSKKVIDYIPDDLRRPDAAERIRQSLKNHEVYLSTLSDAFTGGTTGLIDHGSLDGLGDDDHPQYLLLAGRAPSQGVSGTVTFQDSGFQLLDNVDPTKVLQFQASGITAGQTRTVTAQDSNGTMALLEASQTWTAANTFTPTADVSAITLRPGGGSLAYTLQALDAGSNIFFGVYSPGPFVSCGVNAANGGLAAAFNLANNASGAVCIATDFTDAAAAGSSTNGLWNLSPTLSKGGLGVGSQTMLHVAPTVSNLAGGTFTGIDVSPVVSTNSGSAGTINGLAFTVQTSGTNTVGSMVGVQGQLKPGSTNTTTQASCARLNVLYLAGAGNTTTLNGLDLSGFTTRGVVTTLNEIRLINPIVAAGSITTLYGIFSPALTVAGTNWFIYSQGGNSSHLGNWMAGSNGTPTAYLHLAAGTTAASTGPLKFTTGTSMTSAEAGAVEFTTDDLFFTITTGPARKRVAMADPVGGLTSGRVTFATTNGRLTDDADMTFSTDTLTVTKLSTTLATLTAAAAPGSPAVGDTWNDSTQKTLVNYQGINEYEVGAIWTQYTRGAVSNSAAETSITGTGIGSLSLPANFFMAGKALRVTAMGDYGGTAGPTLRLRFKKGTAVIFDSGAVTITDSSGTWFFEGIVTAQNGTVDAIRLGKFTFVGAATTIVIAGTTSLAPALFNNNAESLDLTAQFSAANALNSAGLVPFVVEVIA